VIVAPEGVARDIALVGVREHTVRIRLRFGQVVHAGRNDAHGAGYQFGRSTAFATVFVHVVHLTVMTGGEPLFQVSRSGLKVSPGHADLLKAEFLPPAPDPREELCVVEAGLSGHM